MPSTPPSTHPGRLAALLLLALLTGCGTQSAPATGPQAAWAGRELEPMRWLELEPTGEWAAPKEARLERRILVPEDASEWKVSAGEVETRPLEGAEEPRELRLTGPGQRRIEIPGPFDPRRFNRLVVRTAGSTPDMLTVVLQRAGKPALAPLPVIIDKGERVEIGFDLDDSGPSDAAFDTLLIRFTGKTPENRLLSVDLVERQPAAVFPTSGELDWIRLSSDARPATLLFSQQPLESRFRVSKLGGRLEFSYGLPALLRYAQPPSGLKLTVIGEESGATEYAQRPLHRNGRPSWERFIFDLGPFSGEAVRVRFELLGKDKAPVACALAQPELVRPIENPPTVLFITSDTHRRDHVGSSHSGVEVATPALDALAARGVYFEDCASTTNVTLPSHTAMLTGTHPRDTGIFDNMDLLADKADTLAERFRDAGWTALASVSAVWLTPTRSGLGQGFARYGFDEQPQRDSEKSIEDIRRWLPELEGRPLFVWLHIFDAHTPYAPPADFARRYYPADKNPSDPALPKPPGNLIPSSMPGILDPDYIGAMYRAEVSYADAQLGGLIANPRFADAIIALTADHGELLGDHGSWWNHGALAPGTLDVPLMLTWPGAPHGLRVARPVQNHDIGRTLLDLAGYRELAFPGRDLLEQAEHPREAGEARFSISVLYDSASVERDGWFLVAVFEGGYGADKPPAERPRTLQLFELASDPRCLKDLSAQEPERAHELERLLFDYLSSAQDKGWDAPDSIRDPVTQMHLRALGYANDGESEGVSDLDGVERFK